MLMDLLCTDNYVKFNIKAANVIGLHAAIYVNELLNITQKAVRKCTTTNSNFVRVDRGYIQQRTTLSPEEQLTLDDKLSKVGVVLKSDSDPDTLQVAVDTLINIVVEEDAAKILRVAKATAVKAISPTVTKMSARQRTIQGYKNSIVCSNAELLEAYRGWIDGVYANPRGFLSSKAITLFQKGVDEFAQGDLDLALKIIDIATINGWRCVDWAINAFNKEYAKSFYAQRAALPVQSTTNRAQLSDEVF